MDNKSTDNKSLLWIITRINTGKIWIACHAVAKRNRHRFFIIKIARNGTKKKGDFQNGTATDFSKKTEGNGEGEASQCGACQDSA